MTNNIETIKLDLLAAIDKGDLVETKRIIDEYDTPIDFAVENYPFLNSYYTNIEQSNVSPLYLAVSKNRLDIAKYLLGLKPSLVNKTYDDTDISIMKGDSLLIVATRLHYEPMVKLLLSNGANPNYQTDKGYSALYVASRNGSLNIVKLLVEDYNANVNIQTIYGNTPLHIASVEGNDKIVRYLLGHKADPNILNYNDSSAMDLVATKILCITKKYRVAHRELIDAIIENYDKILNQDLTPGSIKSFINILNRFRNKGIKVNINRLFLRDANIRNGGIFLHELAENGNVDELKAILSNGKVNINKKDINGLTALHLATYHGHDNVVKLLLEHGANPNVKDNNLMTPLYYAIEKRDLLIANLLLTSGASVTTKDKFGYTPIEGFLFLPASEWAARSKSLDKEMITILLDRIDKSELSSYFHQSTLDAIHNFLLDINHPLVEEKYYYSTNYFSTYLSKIEKQYRDKFNEPLIDGNTPFPIIPDAVAIDYSNASMVLPENFMKSFREILTSAAARYTSITAK